MNLASIRNKATSKVGRQILHGRKQSPQILFIAGVGGVILSTVLACRATLQMSEILDEAEKNRQDIEKAAALQRDDYDQDAQSSDTALNKTKTVLKIGRLYAVPVVVGALSIGALSGSHVILNRRNAALSTTLAAVSTGFREYRNRVIGELGPEKDREFRFGVTEREIAVETDEGVAVKTIRELVPGHSIYARHFNESNMRWERVPLKNQAFLQAQQNYANDLLRSRGHVTLNEVYEALGFDHTKPGMIVGWVLGNGDNRISFGIFDDPFNGKMFWNGETRDIQLDFNVDGVIYDLI